MLKLLKSTRSPEAAQPSRQDDLSRLAASARGGQPEAVRTLLVLVGPAILRVIRRMLGPDHPDVEDLTQEAAFNVVRALQRYRGECSVLHFVCRVSVQTAMNSRRREEVRTRPLLQQTQGIPEWDPELVPTPEEALARQEAIAMVRDLLCSLPATQAEALALHCIVGYTVTEIAECTDVSPETVRSRLRLARQALRRGMASRPKRWEATKGVS